MRIPANVCLPCATLLFAVLLMSLASMASASVLADLATDWSNTNNPNTNNPNGTWEYRQGTSDLPLVSPWDAAGSALLGCNQPAWAPSDSSGNFLPAELQANSCSAAIFSSDSNISGNVLPGDVVMHTQDDFNGVGEGQGNYLFTSKVASEVSISGKVWDADTFYGTSRPQEWILLFNGNQIASGTLSGVVSRSQAQTFKVNEPLTVGSTIELELERTSTAGYFVGAQLTVSTVPCVLRDKLSYKATSDTLTMKFTVGTNSAATWDAWLVDLNEATLSPLSAFPQSLPVTVPPKPVRETTSLSPSGVVGVLSTLTTPTQGITCSSFQTINTGTP